VDGQSLEAFGQQLGSELNRLQRELKEEAYPPQPVRQVQIPKAGKPGEFRTLGIPTIYDRVCQQALFNRLEPIFEPVFDNANFGYRRGRSAKCPCGCGGCGAVNVAAVALHFNPGFSIGGEFPAL
jgi:RNA-directed DNA polymerase